MLLAACQRKVAEDAPRAQILPAKAAIPVDPAVLSAELSSAGLQVPSGTLASTDFTLPTLDGRKVSLGSLKGKVVFLNFWATWCPPCRAEMPSMETLYQRYKDRGLEILAVDLKEEKKTVSEFVDQNKLTFTILLDSTAEVGGIYGTEAIPTTYIVDRLGNIVARAVGGLGWDTPAMFAIFDKLLAL